MQQQIAKNDKSIALLHIVVYHFPRRFFVLDEEIGKLIRSRREELGLSSNYVADQLDVNRSTLSRWETGNIKTIKRSHIWRLSQILHIPVDVFLEENPNLSKIESAEIVKEREILIETLSKITDLSKLKDIETFISAFVIKK